MWRSPSAAASSSELKKTASLHTAVTRNVRPTRHWRPRRILRGPQIEFSSTDTWQRAVISAAENLRKLLINVFYVVPEEEMKKNVDKHLTNILKLGILGFRNYLELKVNFLLAAQGLDWKQQETRTFIHFLGSTRTERVVKKTQVNRTDGPL